MDMIVNTYLHTDDISLTQKFVDRNRYFFLNSWNKHPTGDIGRCLIWVKKPLDKCRSIWICDYQCVNGRYKIEILSLTLYTIKSMCFQFLLPDVHFVKKSQLFIWHLAPVLFDFDKWLLCLCQNVNIYCPFKTKTVHVLLST